MIADDSIIDLRSDTVTVPTPEMLQAMMDAPVGDDVYGEDPSVNRLEAMVAELLGQEAAVFVPSGTMANLVAIRTHTEPGDEIILDENSHPYHYEGGSYAAVAGVSVRFVHADRGIIQPQQIPPLVRTEDVHFARSRLVVVENTHNRGGGSVYPVETVAAIGETCRDLGLRLHMDGARLLNACTATGAAPEDYGRHADSVSICLSKGLGCPVGSVLAGDTAFVARARRFRKMFGGAMRQAGYLAAAGIYALEHNVERMAEDHANAQLLAEGVRAAGRLALKYDPPETNMVYFRALPPLTADELATGLKEQGILVGNTAGDTFRAVTHIGTTEEHIRRVVAVMESRF
ncbi:MAG: low-specificity L-threonine aldolase [Candidatus Brocadiia bacterium]